MPQTPLPDVPSSFKEPIWSQEPLTTVSSAEIYVTILITPSAGDSVHIHDGLESEKVHREDTIKRGKDTGKYELGITCAARFLIGNFPVVNSNIQSSELRTILCL